MSVSHGGGSDIVSVDLGGHALAAADQLRRDRRQPLLQPRRESDRLQLRPRRRPAALRDGCRRRRGEADQLRPGRYATPVWSPRGDLIAFTRFGGEAGNFSIGVMHPDGSGERILSEGFSVEGPTFAPNGRVLMFWRQIRGARQPRLRLLVASGLGRHHRLQRAGGADADRRLRSGLVAAGGMMHGVNGPCAVPVPGNLTGVEHANRIQWRNGLPLCRSCICLRCHPQPGTKQMNSKILGALAAVALLGGVRRQERTPARRPAPGAATTAGSGAGQPGRPGRQCRRSRLLRLRPARA